jgi:hypothetical protein
MRPHPFPAELAFGHDHLYSIPRLHGPAPTGELTPLVVTVQGRTVVVTTEAEVLALCAAVNES